eukprot:gene168-167_t
MIFDISVSNVRNCWFVAVVPNWTKLRSGVRECRCKSHRSMAALALVSDVFRGVGHALRTGKKKPTPCGPRAVPVPQERVQGAVRGRPWGAALALHGAGPGIKAPDLERDSRRQTLHCAATGGQWKP